MKKRYLAVALFTTAALVLSACSSSPGEDKGATDAEGQTLNVWIMQGTNPDSEDFFDRVGADFEKTTGAKLNVDFVGWADAHDRFVTAIAGGTTPDVAETGNTWTGEFADAGGLAPLDDYVNEASLTDDLVEGLVKSGTYEDQLFGMPWYAGVRALMYRTDVFEELDLDAPATWAELKDAIATVKAEKPDLTPFPVPGDAENLVYPWVWGAGGEVATQDGDTWTSGLDSPQAREGLKFYTDLALEQGSSTAGATTWKESDLLDSFAQGDVAMAIMGSWTPSTVIEKNPDLEGKIGAVPMPGKNAGEISPSFLGGSHLSMFETSENKDLSWEFIQLMTTGDYAAEWASQTGYFPGQISLLEDTMENASDIEKPFAKQFVEGGASLPVSPSFGKVQAKATTNTMMQAILSGKKTVDEATTDAANEMTDILNGE